MTSRRHSDRPVSMGIVKLTIIVSLTLHPGRLKAETPNGDCKKTLAPDGRTIRQGTSCIAIVVFEEGSFEVKLQDGQLLVDHDRSEIEIEYGAVHAIAGSAKPDFIVRRSKHFIRTVIEKDSTLWVNLHTDKTLVSVETAKGETLITTSWDEPFSHRPEDRPYNVSLSPEEGGEMICSVNYKGSAPNNMAVLLAVVAALSLVARRRERQS